MSREGGPQDWQTLQAFSRRKPFAASIMAAPVQRSAMEASYQRLTLRQTRRIVPFMFSMILVQASERGSSAGKRLWRCRPGPPASLRLRPYCGRRLDLGNAHPVAVLQFQKAHQAQLGVGALPQGRPSGACLLEMKRYRSRCSTSGADRYLSAARGKKISSNIIAPPF